MKKIINELIKKIDIESLALIILISFFSVFMPFLWETFNKASGYFFLFGVVLFFFILAFTLVLLYYLLNKYSNTPLSDVQFLNQKKKDYLNQILGALKVEISKELRKKLENGDLDNAQEEINDKITALNKLAEIVKNDNSKALIGTDIGTMREFYESTSIRIKDEIKRIGDNAKISMLVGFIATIFSIFVLFFSLEFFKLEPAPLLKTNIIEIIPRITLSLLVQALAFYFFNLYKKQQEEIKYWNNEKTSLDIKIFTFNLVIEDHKRIVNSNNKETPKFIIATPIFMQGMISELLKTDRNSFSISEPKDVKEKTEEKPKEELEPTKLVSELVGKIKDLADQLNKK